MQIDYSRIVLMPEEIRLLKNLSKTEPEKYIDCTTSLSSDSLWKLQNDLHYIEHRYDGDDKGNLIETGEYRISLRGKRYLQYLKTTNKKENLKEVRAWITLAVAILGLIGSIVALIWQGISQGNIGFSAESSTTSAFEQEVLQSKE